MHKIVTFKSICIRIFFSLLIAAAALYGLIIYQKPAFYYDVLIASRPAKQPSPNLLLIDTGSVEGGGIIDSALALSVVDTLIELEADTLIIQTPVLGVASGGKISESDLSAGFDEEFGLVTSNIRNLFTGITMGLIEPADIESYIDETVRLTEAGKARLLQSAFKGDEELLDNIEKSQAAFGRVFAAPELLMQLIRAGGTEAAAVRASLTTYSRAEPDSDGLVRRVRPVIQTENGPIEHITFTALKSRFSSVEFVETRFNAALSLQPASAKTRPAPPPAADGGDAANGGAAADGGDAVGGGDAANGGAAAGGVDAAGDEGAAGGGIAAGGESVADGGDAADGGVAAGGEGAAGGGSAAGGVDAAGGEGAIDERILIPLDRDGAIRFDHPADTHDFKYIPINLLIDYAEGDKTLYKLLAEGVSLSRYSRIEPERYPPFIYEKNTGIYRQLLDAPDDTVKALWRDGRAAYFAACAAFFSAETEQAIHNSFAGLLEDENLGEEGRDKVLAMRDKEFEKFNIARDYYNSVRRARAGLEKNLAGALCVMGQRGEGRLSDAEISILLADSLLTGSGIYPVNERYTFYFSAAAVFLAVVVMCSFAPFLSCCFSIGFSAVVFLIFAQVFVKSGFWLDPLIPSVSVLTGGLTSAFLALILRLDGGRLSLFDITAVMPRAYIKSMFTHDIRQNKSAAAAIAAVRLPDFGAFETSESAERAARRLQQFHAEARALFIKAGAVLAGTEHGLLVFAFGSPLEILAGKKKRGKKAAKETPVRRAARFLAKIDFSKIKTSPWYIGLDVGESVFCAFDTSGYHVSGPPAARARVCSSIAGNHNAQILLTAAAAAQLDQASLRKIDAGAETYYELKTAR